MPHHPCEYCETVLSSSQNLTLHQSSAQYCIEIQRSKGIITEFICYVCECGSSHSQKSNFKRHQKTCKNRNKLSNMDQNISHGQGISQNIGQNIGQTINQTINQTNIDQSSNIYTVNNTIKAFTIQDLTNEYIIAKLTPVITKEICKSGIGAITEIIVQTLLQRDGKYCYYCTNSSKKKFAMLIDHEGRVIENNDPNALYLRSILSIPLMEIVGIVVEKNTTEKTVQTHEDIENLDIDGKTFTCALAATLPNSPEGMHEALKEIFEKSKDPEARMRLHQKRLELKLKYKKDELIYMNPRLAESPKNKLSIKDK